MSGGGTNTVTQNSGPPPWAVPYFQNFLGRAGQVADLPYQPYTGQRNAEMSPYTAAGANAQAQRAVQGSPTVGAANQQLTGTMQGNYFGNVAQNPYFGSNPYLQSQIDQSSQDVVRNYNTSVKPQLDAAMTRSGSFGNSGIQQMQQAAQSDLQRNLGDISNRFRFQDYSTQQNLGESAANRAQGSYENERQRQMSAAGMAPSIAGQDYLDAQKLMEAGQPFTQQQQALLDTQYGNFTEARDYPKQQLGVLGNALGMNMGGSSSSTQPGVSNASQALGWASLYRSLAGSNGGSK